MSNGLRKFGKKSLAAVLSLALLLCLVPFCSVSAQGEAYFASPWTQSIYEAETAGQATVSGSNSWQIKRYNNWEDKSGEVDSSIYKSGNSSVKLPMTGATATGPSVLTLRGLYFNMSDVFDRTKTYNLSFWMKKDTYDISDTYLHFYYAVDVVSGVNEVHFNGNTTNGNPETVSCPIANTTDWQFMSYTFTLDNAKFDNAFNASKLSEMRISARSRANSISGTLSLGSVWVDQIRLVEVPEEADYTTSLLNREYRYTGINGSVTEAVFGFGNSYADADRLIPSVDGTALSSSSGYTAKKTVNNDGTATISVSFAEPVEEDKLTFTMYDIWGRTISDTAESSGSAYITTPYAETVYEAEVADSAANWMLRSYVSGNSANNSKGTLKTDTKHSGEGSLYFSLVGTANWGEFFSLRSAYNQMPLKKNTTYCFSYWLKKDNVDVTKTYIRVFADNKYENQAGQYTIMYNAAKGGTAAIAPTTEWQYVSHTFTTDSDDYNSIYAKPDVFRIDICIAGMDANAASVDATSKKITTGGMYIDQVSLVEVPADGVCETTLTDISAEGNVLTLTYDTMYAEPQGVTVTGSDGAALTPESISESGSAHRTTVLTFAEGTELSGISVSSKDIWGREVKRLAKGDITFAAKTKDSADDFAPVSDSLALIGRKNVTVKVTAEITDSTGNTPGDVYIACLQSGRLVKCGVVSADAADCSVSFDLEKVTADTQFKVFVWESGTLRPLLK